MHGKFLRRIILGSLLILAVLAGGTTGYMLIESWPFLDSLYMTCITVTTVGFSEIHPLSNSGRAFTMLLMLTGVGLVFYLLTTLTQAVVGGELRQIMGRRTLQRQIRALKGHYIICGYGRIGALVAHMLHEQGVNVVVVENSEEVTRRLETEGILYVLGSATDDEVLMAAGIDRARGLLASVSSDADNLYLVLSAKGLRPDLFVIARATDLGGERKLKRAGADKVISPYFIGARRIAQTVLRPSVADFVDLTFHSTDMALQMEELVVGHGSELDGVTLKDSGIRQKLNLIILAVKRSTGEMIFNPEADTMINLGDTLIALGTRDSMIKLGQRLGAV